jgi:hypothetical protein
VVALAFIRACLFVPVVAREVLEVLQDDSAVEFCVELVAKNICTCANYDISIHRMDAAREGQGDLLI